MAIILLAVALASWWVTFLQFGPMMMMDMSAFSLDVVPLSLFTVSWTVGMVAMMFPTSVPMMLMFIRIGKTATAEIRAGGGPTLTKAILFIASYIAMWVAVGVLFYFALGAASRFFQLSSFFDLLMSPIGVGLALLIVGLYQLSPIKGECLDRCHPTSFLFKHYSGGRVGAAKMGIVYAKYCVGCCWVMMLFLLLIGAMGPLWMVLFTSLIFLERAIVHGRWLPRIIGLAFLTAGTIRLVTA
jgi:predicted metal-binding membrane protein